MVVCLEKNKIYSSKGALIEESPYTSTSANKGPCLLALTCSWCLYYHATLRTFVCLVATYIDVAVILACLPLLYLA